MTSTERSSSLPEVDTENEIEATPPEVERAQEAAMARTDAAPAGARRRQTDGEDVDRFVRLAVDAALEKKAEELAVLDLGTVSDFTDRFVITHGSNERQVQAIADAVTDTLRENGLRPLHVEGYDRGRWVLLDYGGDLVVHVFLGDTRRYYQLERLWSDAPDVTDRFVSGDAEASASK